MKEKIIHAIFNDEQDVLIAVKTLKDNDVNVNGTENILKLAEKNKFKVVYASSSSVYGNPERIPIKEEDSKNPINPYAETKLQKEK